VTCESITGEAWKASVPPNVDQLQNQNDESTRQHVNTSTRQHASEPHLSDDVIFPMALGLKELGLYRLLGPIT